MAVQPVPGEPAAIADADGRTLVVADYHAGIEADLRTEGVELPARDTDRREHLCRLIGETDPERVLFLGDLTTAVGTPGRAERAELAALFESIAPLPVTVVKGNHDGGIESVAADTDVEVDVTATDGVRLGDVGFAHGHTWPSMPVLAAPTLCTAHEHPMVRLEDQVGGHRIERVWLRGRIDPTPFERHYDRAVSVGTELVVVPAFNDVTGGTWVNADRDFLSPFLPEALLDGEAYLLDGTRLGRYHDV